MNRSVGDAAGARYAHNEQPWHAVVCAEPWNQGGTAKQNKLRPLRQYGMGHFFRAGKASIEAVSEACFRILPKMRARPRPSGDKPRGEGRRGAQAARKRK